MIAPEIPAVIGGERAGIVGDERTLMRAHRGGNFQQRVKRIAFEIELRAGPALVPAGPAPPPRAAGTPARPRAGRPSGRGCTVMPCAPASSAMPAARVTLGMPSVRVLRSSAILLRLTLRRVIVVAGPLIAGAC